MPGQPTTIEISASTRIPLKILTRMGFITLVRITDPTGTFVECDEDKRIMVPADLAKGETGRYKVISEGLDNDDDDKFNEDGSGGVIFNKNFTYNYEEYGVNAGLHAMSEPESKAVADFLYDHFNIYMTLAFGPQDNLGQPMKASERPAASRQVREWDQAEAQEWKQATDGRQLLPVPMKQ